MKPTQPSPWPLRWAWALACATFTLVAWGGFVTATGSGMAFRDWLTSDGVFMPFYPWLRATGSKFIEHGHRLLGMTAGILSLALIASCWLGEASRTAKRFSIVLLIGVLLQGVLGGMRVVLDERLLALLHGCAGPLFFAATAVMVVLTGRSNDGGAQPASDAQRRLARVAVVTAVLAYLQLVLGALVRHAPLMTSPSAAGLFQTAVYLHVVAALAVTAHIVILAVRCLRTQTSVKAAIGLAALLAVQLLLGVSSWIVKYGLPAWATSVIGETGHFNRASDMASAAVVTSHGAIGALIVALAAAIATRLVLHAGRYADVCVGVNHSELLTSQEALA